MNTEKNLWHCKKCGASGNSVTLYARIYGIDNRTAVERLKGIPGTCFTAGPKRREKEVAPLSVRHDVYYDMLNLMPLYPEHLENLLHRGLDREQIQDHLYRSIPSVKARNHIAAVLARKHQLQGVPGFYWDGEWKLWGREGIIFPILDADGYIQGCQIRLSHPGSNGRFRWLSSNPEYKTKDGFLLYPFGAAASGWVHVTGNTQSDTAFITEGGMKGDISSAFLHDALFLCVPGAGTLGELEKMLDRLPQLYRAILCYDMDMWSNMQVYSSLLKLMEMLKRRGLYCQMAKWERYKGIDDALRMESASFPASIQWNAALPCRAA